jgi:hypothetical protein
MLMMPHTPARTRFSDWPLAVKSILGFWLFYALTVAARAFLGSDPWTTLENKLLMVGVGIVLTGLIYVSISELGARSSIRRKAVIAVLASMVASVGMAAAILGLENQFRESKEEFRFQAREGFVVVEKGQTVRIERSAQEPPTRTSRAPCRGRA